MLDRSFRRWLIVLALLGVVLDQASKYVVFRWLHEPGQVEGNHVIFKGVFRLHTQYTGDPASGFLLTLNGSQLPHVNRGALFGMMNDRQESNYIFALISLIAGGAIIAWSFKRKTSSDRLLCIALGLILGGTIGNLYDRLVFGGVRDFLYFHLIEWPVFNIADCCLVVGACLLLFQAFLTNPALQSQPEAGETSTAALPSAAPV